MEQLVGRINVKKENELKENVNSGLNEKPIKEKQPLVILFGIVVFAAIFLLNYYFILTCDDITYSLSSASLSGTLTSALNQGSGRLLGNFLGFLVRHKTFIAIEKTVVWFGIISLFVKLIGSKNYIVNTIIVAVIIYPCDTIFAQAYAWNAGFQNYTVPVFIMLLCIYLIKTAGETENSGKRTLCYIIMLIASFAGQFFSENCSVAAVLLAFFMLIYSAKCNKKSLLYTVTYFISVTVGFVTMMAYPYILGTNTNMASYRSYADSLSSFINFIVRNFRTISRNFAGYFALWIVVSIAFFWLINKVLSKKYNGTVWNVVFLLSKLILVLYPVFSLCYEVIIEDSITYPRYYFRITLCVALIAYAAVLLFTSILLFLTKSVEKQYKLPGVLMVLAMLTLAPLLVVSPIGARTFYVSFIFVFMSAMCVLKNVVENVKFKNADGSKSVNNIKVFYVCAASICCLFCVIFMAEVDNSYCNNIRNAYLSAEIEAGNQNITLPYVPHQNIVHEDGHKSTYKLYIRRKYSKEDVELNFIDWNTWYSDYYLSSNN